MIRSVAVYASAIIALVLAGVVHRHTHLRELDSTGNPILRYLGDPYVIAVCGAAFLAAGIYQWFVPLNHRYPGNLLVISYLPAILGIAALGFALHVYLYRATLRNGSIVVSRWPASTKTFNLGTLEAIEDNGSRVTLRFAGDKKYVVYSNLSGRAHFLAALSANNSIQRTPTRYAGRRR